MPQIAQNEIGLLNYISNLGISGDKQHQANPLEITK
jgi:hypothetical protein